MNLHLKIVVPTAVIVDEPVQKIIAEGGEGVFCIKPRHIDYVSALVPSILIYLDAAGREHYLATDEGCLVKCASQVLVSSRHAVQGENLGELKNLWMLYNQATDEQARKSRAALASLEMGVVRKFIEFQDSR